jgi:hypothetical protein
MALEIKFGFDELQLPNFGAGMLLYGTAYLQSAGDGDFWVQSIELDNGTWLRSVREGQTLNALLYREIAAVLYDDSTDYGAKAAEAWGEAWTQSRRPDPDRSYDERRDAYATRENAPMQVAAE